MKYFTVTNKFFTVAAIMALALLVTGCMDKRVEGYVMKAGEERLLLAEEITEETYEKIKDQTISEWKEEQIPLTYIRYDRANELEVGDKVEAWIDDIDFNETVPVKAYEVILK
ncbi:DUF3221 domain-containing protein [Virgibacillus xinjiangensis]|uniref:DUF3221 domain-containing protein n=1 Tax=Virgibacillus xinjiangensis TaxID=393090 RepID=A0ABV7CWI5_9BACI